MYLVSSRSSNFFLVFINLAYTAIGKKTDPRNEKKGRYGFENKVYDTTREYCKETLSPKTHANMEYDTHTIMEYDIPTDYDSNEIYIIPNDTNLDHEYISMEYSKGILLIHCIFLISGVDGSSTFY